MNVIVALAMSWCVAALLVPVVPRLDRLFAPAVLVRVLSAGALVLTVATTSSAVAAAACLLFVGGGAVGWMAAVLIVCLLAVSGVRAGRHGVRVRASMRAAGLFRDSALRDGDVLIVEDEVPDAFAVPGRRPVVVVTAGLRKSLPAAEFRAVVRHERAHLRARHYVHVQLVELAALLNPLLSGWPAAVRFATERHADECAAAVDRPATARALARAAMLCSGSHQQSALSIVGGRRDVVRRVQALRHPRPARQRRWAVAVAVVVMLALLTNAVTTADLIQDRIAPEPREAPSVVVG
ncbi:MAG TPA: M48 family metalloprotease [Mycobacterium sp.]|nr:M48 family metalloprotease [Mycobacterium sp.]